MTKFLSQMLEAPEPYFRLGLQKLEAAAGHPNTDIRFSLDMSQAAKDKLRELGLDPNDTTPEELYHVLQSKIKADDKHLTKTLRTLAATHVSAEADPIAGMIHAIKDLPDSKRCFALKASALKSILKKVPPKKAMKQLGYRSLDSFLKHEAPVSILAAAALSEDDSWHRRLRDKYKKLQAGDFESRSIQIVQLDSGRWRELAQKALADNKHNVLCFKEIGALAFLPLPASAPAGSMTASLCLALHELNEIRASSTFLKLCQVRPDFGTVVRTIADEEPHLQSQLLDQDVPWHIIQRYYAQLARNEHTAVLEPHLEQEDMAWHPLGKSLSAIEPSLGFWQHASHLGLLSNDGPVSMNVIDAALNACNDLPFNRRVSQYFKQSTWHELLLHYLQPAAIEQALISELQPQLAEEAVAV
ncbi:MAG TPA: hypothetical protein VHB72_04890 [Candidatus Saccharimonadales bacterium]|nr:hypothetical protein [Candidatus Saccharimonadales bacterium]